MAAKIKDGLFIGDAETSQDPEFLELNKISNLVNLAGRDVPNVWASHGLVYLNYNWEDRPDFKLFDDHDDAVADLVEFVDTSLRHGVSVLLFSRRGMGRSAVAMCAYLMFKYHWGFEKSFDFIYSKKPDIDINKGFVHQLFELDKRLHLRRQQQLRIQSGDPNIEILRWKEWDPGYVQHDQNDDRLKGDNTSGKRLRDDVIEETPDDELVMIHSYLNGKQTITSLPLPNRAAIDIPKAFKLRFNSELQEEDIHMFPTSPPKGHASIPKRGILKKHGNFQGQRAHSATKGHQHHLPATAQSKPVLQDTYDAPSTRQQPLGGQAKYQDVSEASILSINDSDEKFDERDNISIGSKDSRDGFMLQKQQYSIQQQQLQLQRQQQQQQQLLLQQQQGRSKSIQQNGAPQVSKRGANPAAGSQEDLYQFIGLGTPGSYNNPPSRSSMQSTGVAPNSNSRAQGNNSKDPISVEDRLLKLVADMQVGGSSSSNVGIGVDMNQNLGDGQYGGSRQGINNSNTRGSTSTTRENIPMDSARQAYKDPRPTLYDLANMHVQSGMPGNGKPNGRNSAVQDPLAAFEMMQQGGAIKVRHDLAPGQRTFATPAGPGPRDVRGAWVDEATASNANNASRRPPSPSPSSSTAGSNAPQLSGQAPKTYRHGSPAPNRTSRGASGNTQQPAAASAGVGTRGAWTGSGSSVTSVGSNSGSNGQVPSPRNYSDRLMSSTTKDTSSRTNPAPYLQARRDGSPSAQQRKTAERPASPTPQLRAKNPAMYSNGTSGPSSSPMRAPVNASAGYSGNPSTLRRSSQSSDAGDAGSYTSLASMNSDGNNSSSARPRGASPMLAGSRMVAGVPSGNIASGNNARPSTPTRSWRF